jgi:hypothetical protein
MDHENHNQTTDGIDFGSLWSAHNRERWRRDKQRTFKDLGANAYFYSTDPSGCVVMEAYIFATQHYFQSPPGPGSEGPFVSLLIFKNDVCSATDIGLP